MQRVFGLPIGGLSIGLIALVALAGAVIGVIAIRQRVFFRMGVRNIRRRPARSSLIVVGLMLGTAIICSALATGDTMGRTVRRSVIEAMGGADEQVTAKATTTGGVMMEAGSAAVQWFSQADAADVAQAARQSGAVDGVTPAINLTVAVQDQTSRQNEPRVNLFASDPATEKSFSQLRSNGRAVSLSMLGTNEVFLNDKAASDLQAQPGDHIVVLAGERLMPFVVKDIVKAEGAGTSSDGLLLPLAQAQTALGRSGQITHVLISNTGGFESGVHRTDQVVDVLKPAAAARGLDVAPIKHDGLVLADKQGNSFVGMFTSFGSFSIAAGILLIFLVFVMLAAERRGEMGMARAVGTQRRHLVETFLFEGAAYDVAAAAVGAALGVAVAYGMVAIIGRAFAGEDFTFTFGVQARSLVVAYSIGVLLTLAVVTVSAWRVSRLNIVSAIRDIPEEHVGGRRRRRWTRAAAGLLFGGLITASGASAHQATPFNLGISVIIASLVLVAIAVGASPRVAYTIAGLLMVVWWLLPPDLFPFVRDLAQDMSIWIVGGLAIVVGATWVVTWNADALLGATMRVFGRIRRLTPVLKMAMAYPLRSRFRTAVTLSMFMLVVFTMVTGSAIPGSVMNAMGTEAKYGGGFDIRATTSSTGAVADMPVAAASAPGVDYRQFDAVASQSAIPVKMAQGNDKLTDYVVRGVDDSYTSHVTYGFSAMATGYTSARQVWEAVAKDPTLAIVDSIVAPRRDNFMVGGVLPDFKLHGFAIEDGTFTAVPVIIKDPAGAATINVKVIGVLSGTAPYDLTAGLWVSQRTLAPFGDRARPTIHYFSVRPGVSAKAAAAQLERAFLANGMQAESISTIMNRSVGASRTLIRLIQGFMGLGLVVGVAALGVISARSVVERRQQLGVLRAIGFQPGMIRRTMLLESSMVAVSAIVIGTALGLAMSYNVLSNMGTQPGWQDLHMTVPWTMLGIIFGVVYVAALAASWLPAVRASRIYPAEALRYA